MSLETLEAPESLLKCVPVRLRDAHLIIHHLETLTLLANAYGLKNTKGDDEVNSLIQTMKSLTETERNSDV
jgi:hypothetical protein